MAITHREQKILLGALNAWPHAVSIPSGRMQEAANRLLQLRLLAKGKHGGKKTPAYRITDAGKMALKAAGTLTHERHAAEMEHMLRESMEDKVSQY